MSILLHNCVLLDLCDKSLLLLVCKCFANISLMLWTNHQQVTTAHSQYKLMHRAKCCLLFSASRGEACANLDFKTDTSVRYSTLQQIILHLLLTIHLVAAFGGNLSSTCTVQKTSYEFLKLQIWTCWTIEEMNNQINNAICAVCFNQ